MRSPASSRSRAGWARHRFQSPSSVGGPARTGLHFFGYPSSIGIDYITKFDVCVAHPARRGASPETILKAERGVANDGLGPKPPRWSAERRARHARVCARRAPRLTRAANKINAPVGAPSPSIRGRLKIKCSDPGANALGNEGCCWIRVPRKRHPRLGCLTL